MPSNKKKFKSPPKRYHPKGIQILYEDYDILVVDKRGGLLTMGHEKEREKTAYYMLTDYVRKGNRKSRNRLFIVHRLDRDTSGVLVFAKSYGAKHYLQDEWEGFTKTYVAVVHGAPPEEEGLIRSYLAENAAFKMYSVDDSTKGKLAKTAYKVLQRTKRYSLLEIDLLTGRKNQIRVHLSELGCAVAGDKKYGGKERGVPKLALHAHSLTIKHPHSKEPMTFEAEVPNFFHSLMGLSP
jgi:tRNA pseudouridine32 synthase/23S rRNA pseudouridine746 synthase/23S rRNA pseudouridine1911/1915/1917 synthase